MVSSPETYAALTAEARRLLSEAGIENAAFEARQLAAFAMGGDTAALLRDYPLPVPDGYRNKLSGLVSRRKNGEPLAYILGTWEFFGIEFYVSHDVLIPRIDTETAIIEAQRLLKGNSSPRIMDLCTGSGCIGLTLLSLIPEGRAVMGDISEAALCIARKNAEKLGLENRAEIMSLDALSPFPGALSDFDMIISNPPYIPTREIETLDVSVRSFEPLSALDGGDDGLDFYRIIIPLHKERIKPGGFFVFEIGEEQDKDVMDILSENGFCEVSAVMDTAGTNRVIIGRRPL
ncbi:MAG: peptide chain release factor N(5)-glutamine methyltransferase [Oscillospiraceae bacterium]|nr:peptide chain release factor N(5)-glutamine methyltransferase [Oscillospiraceae bacterium]